MKQSVGILLLGKKAPIRLALEECILIILSCDAQSYLILLYSFCSKMSVKDYSSHTILACLERSG